MISAPGTRPCLVDEVDGTTYPIAAARWQSDAGHTLRVSGLPGLTAPDIDRRQRSLWRYHRALPIDIREPVSLGEGCTPLVRRRFRGHDAWFKLEWFMPTGSFKDRGASVMISLLRQQGIGEILEDSSGNGGAAIAAYGAAAGMTVHVLVPDHAGAEKIAQIAAYSARIQRIPGSRQATEDAALAMAERVFYASHNRHPFFIQGTKTLGYEIWEDLAFTVPDNIVIPTGAGSNILGCDLAFGELMAAGAIDRLPRLFAAQPAQCAPVDRAFRAGADDHVAGEVFPTVAEGTAIARPVRMPALLQALRRSGGGTVAVPEPDIIRATRDLAAMGLFAEPTSAMAAAALDALHASGRIGRHETTVVVLTGSGLKASAYFAAVMPSTGCA